MLQAALPHNDRACGLDGLHDRSDEAELGEFKLEIKTEDPGRGSTGGPRKVLVVPDVTQIINLNI